jgi:phosphoenolpyruvate carboxylase
METIKQPPKYSCNVDYMCTDLNQLSSHYNHQIEDQVAKKQCAEIVEKLRVNIDALRTWGHDLRKKLIATEIEKNDSDTFKSWFDNNNVLNQLLNICQEYHNIKSGTSHNSVDEIKTSLENTFKSYVQKK